MGGGKGGSGLRPAGKSDDEVMRFCYAFMTGTFQDTLDRIKTFPPEISVLAEERSDICSECIKRS